jgi:hypothetical protein
MGTCQLEARDWEPPAYATSANDDLFSLKPQAAFSFDGVNDYVTFGTNAGNFGTGDFTIALWLKTATSNTLNTQFLVKRAGCNHENFWGLAMAGGPYIEIDQDNQLHQIQNPASLPDELVFLLLPLQLQHLHSSMHPKFFCQLVLMKDQVHEQLLNQRSYLQQARMHPHSNHLRLYIGES